MLFELFIAFVASVFIQGLYWFLTPYFSTLGRPSPLSWDFTYVEVDESKKNQYGQYARYPFKNIFSEPVLHLSVVVPAYNEQQRLPAMLKPTIEYLKQRYKQNNEFTSEIIIVDDGSRDQTVQVVLDFAKQYNSDFIRLLKLPFNMGKGGAVQAGMLHARGKYVLFADADGASDFNCYQSLEDELVKSLKARQNTPAGNSQLANCAIAIGSRAHLAAAETAAAEAAAAAAAAAKPASAQINRTQFRAILQKGFHFFMTNVSGLHEIKDTQCGFKLFTREACQAIFPQQRIQRWCFDVELLYLAKAQHIPISEIPINWHEVDGSKVDIASASLTMARDLVLIRVLYTLGLWSITADVPAIASK